MYADEVFEFFLWVFVFIVVVGGVMTLAISAGNKADKHDQKVRQDMVQCQKDGKDWIFTGKYDNDGVCVTKK